MMSSAGKAVRKRFSENRFSREKRASEQALSLERGVLRTESVKEGKFFDVLTHSCNDRRRARELGDRRYSRNIQVDITQQIAVLGKAELVLQAHVLATEARAKGRTWRGGARLQVIGT